MEGFSVFQLLTPQGYSGEYLSPRESIVCHEFNVKLPTMGYNNGWRDGEGERASGERESNTLIDSFRGEIV